MSSRRPNRNSINALAGNARSAAESIARFLAPTRQRPLPRPNLAMRLMSRSSPKFMFVVCCEPRFLDHAINVRVFLTLNESHRRESPHLHVVRCPTRCSQASLEAVGTSPVYLMSHEASQPHRPARFLPRSRSRMPHLPAPLGNLSVWEKLWKNRWHFRDRERGCFSCAVDI